MEQARKPGRRGLLKRESLSALEIFLRLRLLRGVSFSKTSFTLAVAQCISTSEEQ